MTTFPVTAPEGTFATMLVADQDVIVAARPFANVTVLLPWVEPKFRPFRVTVAPMMPDEGEIDVMIGTFKGENFATKVSPVPSSDVWNAPDVVWKLDD